MRQSELFTTTRKSAPKDEVAKNAQLLIRAGYIHKEMAGVYSFLPLGLRVLNKINDIVREEMNAVGAQELLMPVLQSKELWEKTGRWSDEVVDNWFKTQLKNGADVGLSFTAEEPITNIMRDYLTSYTDLPKLTYQIQWKYRNEERAKSGIMRGREFLMKDLYSFAASNEEHEQVYESLAEAYVKVFERLGIGERTYRTFASGGVFSKYSHEFQCLSDIGEDTVYVHEAKKMAINKEVMLPEVLKDLGITEDELVEKKAIEVGNIFSLGTRFSDALGLKFKKKDGSDTSPVMGCYGIGTSRLVGALVEVFADEKGIVWPKSSRAIFGASYFDLKRQRRSHQRSRSFVRPSQGEWHRRPIRRSRCSCGRKVRRFRSDRYSDAPSGLREDDVAGRRRTCRAIDRHDQLPFRQRSCAAIAKIV